jgi:hypothetical protein
MRTIVVLLLLFLSGVALAQPEGDAQLKRLEAALGAIRQEQQAVYQQFQMINTLTQQTQQQQNTPPGQTSPGQFPNYDDMVREREQQQYRLKDYSYELQRLYDRYRELGERSAALIDQIEALAMSGSASRR